MVELLDNRWAVRKVEKLEFPKADCLGQKSAGQRVEQRVVYWVVKKVPKMVEQRVEK